MGQRRPLTHALRVGESSAAFRPLFAALAEAGERAGWLELDAPLASRAGEATAPERRSLDGALDLGAWKAVAVEERRSTAVKSRRGPPVLRDLLREHFRGCRVVLVRGDVALPALRARGDGWELEDASGAPRRLTTSELLSALRAPRLPV
jgi:hypothetical protein